MLIRVAVLIGAVIVLGPCLRPVSAEQPGPVPAHDGASHCSLPLLRGCPDDYCAKPMPVIHLLHCGGPDDYCRKPCPSVWPLRWCGGCDDYYHKPFPSLCRPLCTAAYSCGIPCVTAKQTR